MTGHPDLPVFFEHDLCGKPVPTFPGHALSNFSHRKRVSLPWTRGIEVLSSLGFSWVLLPQGTISLQFAGGRIITNPLISSGFST
jgi:hypothetical protein